MIKVGAKGGNAKTNEGSFWNVGRFGLMEKFCAIGRWGWVRGVNPRGSATKTGEAQPKKDREGRVRRENFKPGCPLVKLNGRKMMAGQ